MAWCFEDEATPQTDAVLDMLESQEAVVPVLWQLEVANVLIGAQKRSMHRLTAYDASYLALAERVGARLATLNARLGAACRPAGVELVLDRD